MTVLSRIHNAGRFMLRVYVPSDTDFWVARQAFKADLAWQPYLYTAVFWGAAFTTIFGDQDVFPVDRIDRIWLLFGFVSPVVGFVASMMLRQGSGKIRYSAFWLRIAANIGLICGISTYLLAVIDNPRPMTITMYTGCMMFVMVLIFKDLHFLLVAERIAKKIRAKHDSL